MKYSKNLDTNLKIILLVIKFISYKIYIKCLNINNNI